MTLEDRLKNASQDTTLHFESKGDGWSGEDIYPIQALLDLIERKEKEAVLRLMRDKLITVV